MVKAANVLNLLYPKLVHVICCFYRVAEEILGSCPGVDKLIWNVKEEFITAPLWVQQCKEEEPSLPLSKQPVPAPCVMWFDAVP